MYHVLCSIVLMLYSIIGHIFFSSFKISFITFFFNVKKKCNMVSYINVISPCYIWLNNFFYYIIYIFKIKKLNDIENLNVLCPRFCFWSVICPTRILDRVCDIYLCFYFRKRNAQIKKCCVDQGNLLHCLSSTVFPVSPMCCWYFLTDFHCLCLRLSGFPREEASMHKPRACILPSGSEHPRCSSQPSSQW